MCKRHLYGWCVREMDRGWWQGVAGMQETRSYAGAQRRDRRAWVRLDWGRGMREKGKERDQGQQMDCSTVPS